MVKDRLDAEIRSARRPRASGLFSSYKVAMLLLWMGLIGAYLYYAWQNDLSVVEALGEIRGLLHSAYGPLLYLLLFVLRSLLFFSAGILSIVGGIIFGSGADGSVTWAFLYVWLGTVLSALVSFGIARFFGSDLADSIIGQERHTRRWTPYVAQLRDNGFVAVLLMRLLLLPFDPINYLAGCMRVDWRAFTLATVLGILPTAFAFVSFGAAIDMQALAAGQMPEFDLQMLLFAGIILVVSLLLSRYYTLHQRK